MEGLVDLESVRVWNCTFQGLIVFKKMGRRLAIALKCNQCCHSKKLKTQDWAIKNPRKPKVKFLYVFGKFLEKIALFLKKSKLPEKMSFYPPKFSDDLFLVIASNFQICYPDFSNFDHFSPKISYFLQKTTKKCIFGLILKKPRKTQGPFENPIKSQGPQKKPKNPRLLRKTEDLGRKPKQWQRCLLHGNPVIPTICKHYGKYRRVYLYKRCNNFKVVFKRLR